MTETLPTPPQADAPPAPPALNPFDVLNELTAEQVHARIAELDAERAALRVLLKSVEKRELHERASRSAARNRRRHQADRERRQAEAAAT